MNHVIEMRVIPEDTVVIDPADPARRLSAMITPSTLTIAIAPRVKS
jgi:tRNA nucleotidyltransferase (CCA-adding enzyme)